MNTKKVTTFSIFAVLLLSTLFFTTFASAGVGEDIANGLEYGAEQVEPIIKLFLGGEALSGEAIFIKLLMFFLLFAILIRVVKTVPVLQGQTLSIIVSTAITLLTIRFLGTEALIEFMWLPQGVLGVLLITFLPFLIFFYFMKEFDSEEIITKIGWSAFAVIYAALAFIRWDELANGTQWWNNFAWLYLIIAILSGIMVLFGKAIEAYRERQRGRLTAIDKFELALSDIKKKRDKAVAAATDGTGSEASAERWNKRVEREEKKFAALKRRFKA